MRSRTHIDDIQTIRVAVRYALVTIALASLMLPVAATGPEDIVAASPEGGDLAGMLHRECSRSLGKGALAGAGAVRCRPSQRISEPGLPRGAAEGSPEEPADTLNPDGRREPERHPAAAPGSAPGNAQPPPIVPERVIVPLGGIRRGEPGHLNARRIPAEEREILPPQSEFEIRVQGPAGRRQKLFDIRR
jgi:hypothetical protein